MNNPFSVEGKTILVTGASSGIGAEVAVGLAQLKANLVITGRNEERLSNIYNRLSGSNHSKIIADLNRMEDIDKLISELPVLDGVVFCAGIVKTMPVKNITDAAIDQIFETNIISNIRLCKRILREKKIAKGGSVVFISSVSTFNVKIGNSLYSATKGAMNSFSKAMALEVASQKIRVNCIQPGFIKTALLNSGMITDEQLDAYVSKHPLGLGSPDDVANMCVYLLSDASKWVTGSILTIDGGLTLQ